jgi:hypothetical protein
VVTVQAREVVAESGVEVMAAVGIYVAVGEEVGRRRRRRWWWW